MARKKEKKPVSFRLDAELHARMIEALGKGSGEEKGALSEFFTEAIRRQLECNLAVQIPKQKLQAVQKVAEEQRVDLAQVILEAINLRLAGPRLCLSLDPELAKRIDVAAKEVSSETSDYVSDLMWEVFPDPIMRPYSPWLPRPDLRMLLSQNEVFENDKQLIQELRKQAKAEPADSERDFGILTTVPRALCIPGARLETYKSWRDYKRVLQPALDDPHIHIKRLYIDSDPNDQPSQESVEAARVDYAKLLEADEVFLRELVGGRGQKVAERVKFLHCFARDVTGGQGLTSDREFLNDVNIYGELAVSYTVETSHGATYSCSLSRSNLDLQYWRQRFKQLWEAAAEAVEKRCEHK